MMHLLASYTQLRTVLWRISQLLSTGAALQEIACGFKYVLSLRQFPEQCNNLEEGEVSMFQWNERCLQTKETWMPPKVQLPLQYLKI
jgi:hypothetical protein